ncbi:MAG TPA: matrixin family metalloprotease [Candidatus Limnocylindrales bacterium]|nr:matrixin family metalloprotease [Candidatus Limnocylindrales bacterium]
MRKSVHRPRWLPARLGVAMLSATLLMSLFAQTVAAADNMGRKWPVNDEYGYYYRIAWYIDSAFPSSFKSRIYEGSIQWNIDTHLYFEKQTSSNLRTDMYVYYVTSLWPFDNFCAATQANGSSSQLTGATIRFPHVPCSSTWYSGTGTPPSNTIDLLSAAVHEFGHAVELYHAYDPYARHSEAAMWPYIPTSPDTKRYITSWDRAGVHAMYPTR